MNKDDLLPSFDTHNVICCNLDALVRKVVIHSIHEFLELAIQFIESNACLFFTSTFSDSMGVKKEKNGFINYLKKVFSKEIGQDIENFVFFRTKSIGA